MAWGARFSTEEGTDGSEQFSLGREGGHSARRIVHAADMTGEEIETALLAAVGAIAWEAVGRLFAPVQPAGLTMPPSIVPQHSVTVPRLWSSKAPLSVATPTSRLLAPVLVTTGGPSATRHVTCIGLDRSPRGN